MSLIDWTKVDPDRPIRCITLCNTDDSGVWHVVGTNKVASIRLEWAPSESRMVPWLAVYLEDGAVKCRCNAKFVVEVEYVRP